MFRTHFNYGAEVSTEDSYFLWPVNGIMTALIDGDMLPYIVGYTKDDKMLFRANVRVQQGECATIQETPEFLNAADHMNWLLNQWVRGAGCDSARIFLTDSASNFRLEVAFSQHYKGQRNTEKPPFFYELREYLLERHNAELSDGNEADDDMSIALMDSHREFCEEHGVEMGSPEHKVFSNVVCVTKDKDARITIGKHCDPDKRVIDWTDGLGYLTPKYKMNKVATADYEYHNAGFYTRGPKAGQPKTKRVKVGTSKKEVLHKLSGCGLKFFYAQLIMGDTADNYSGLVGKGKAFAYELLDDCTSERELFYAVLNAYRNVWSNGTNNPVQITNIEGKKAMLTPYQLMLEQGRLAWMQTYKGELWRKKDYCPTLGDAIWQ